MATVADTIDLISGTFSFTLSTAPLNGAEEVATGKPKFVTTNGSGVFSTTLDQGTYVVRMPNTPAFTVTVPSGSGTYDMEDIINSSVPASSVTDSTFSTALVFVASTTIAEIVWIDATGSSSEQDGGFFKRGGSGTHDLVNVITRDDGTTYTRIGA